MQISYSAKGDPRGRHITLHASFAEQYDVLSVLRSDVLGTNVRPVVERDETNGASIFRVHERFLDRVLLCFPQAEISAGIVEVTGRAEAKRLKNLPLPDYDFPGFKGKFWGDFQAQGAHQIATGNIDILSDFVGAGKTFEVLAALCKIKADSKDPNYHALIVCPNNVKYTWAECIEKWFDLDYVVLDAQAQSYVERQRLIEKRAQVTIVNTEAIRAKPIHLGGNQHSTIVGWAYSNPALFLEESDGRKEWDIANVQKPHGRLKGGTRHNYDFVCIDEFHRLKTPNAQATNGYFDLQSDRWILLSGTPVLNRPEEIWTSLHRLYPEAFASYDQFCKVLINNSNDGRKIGYHPDAMEELRGFLQEISLRRRKEQVRDDLPEVVDIIHKVEMSEEQRRIYNEVKHDFLLRLDDGTTQDIMGVLPQITRLKQAAFSPELYGGSTKSAKVDRLKEIVAEIVESGEKVIVFSQWSKATRIIQRELAEYNPAYITGEVKSLKARQEEMHRFNNDPHTQILVGTIGANREGVNLGAATYVIFTDLDWVPAGKDQAVGRSAAGGLRGLRLKGQDLKVHVIEIQAEDTIEEWIQGLLTSKRNVANRMIERDAGKQVHKIDVADIAKMLRNEGKK